MKNGFKLCKQIRRFNSSMGEIEILALAIPYAYRSVLSFKPKNSFSYHEIFLNMI
jgi:hypothetical protein